jgi:hypothetical protein
VSRDRAGWAWVLAGVVVLAGGATFALVRRGREEGARQAPPPTPLPERPLAAKRLSSSLPGRPSLVRVARDGVVWAVVSSSGERRLARLRGGILRPAPRAAAQVTDLVESGRRSAPYMAFGAGRTVGYLRPDGRVALSATVPGTVGDVAFDRFANVWFTDRSRSAVGVWDRRRVTELPVRRRPRPLLDDIALGQGGRLWFLDDRGRVGTADPLGRILRLFSAPGGPPSPGPSRLGGGPSGGAWYTTRRSVGKVTERGRARIVLSRPSDPPGPVVSAPDGNVWVAARRGPRLFRLSPSGSVARFVLDVPADARFVDITRDARRGALWIAAARPRALLRVALPELRPKLPGRG